MVSLTERGRRESLPTSQGHCSERRTLSDLVIGWRSGDQSAARELYIRFAHRIELIVSKHLNPRFRRRIDVEDIKQSVFQDVFVHLQRDGLPCENEARMQRWIGSLARNKTIKRVKYERAEKRDADRESRPSTEVTLEFYVEQHGSPYRETPYQRLARREEISKAMSRLDETCRRIVQHLWDGRSQLEIAALLQLTDRTIRRKMQVIRGAFQPLRD